MFASSAQGMLPSAESAAESMLSACRTSQENVGTKTRNMLPVTALKR